MLFLTTLLVPVVRREFVDTDCVVCCVFSNCRSGHRLVGLIGHVRPVWLARLVVLALVALRVEVAGLQVAVLPVVGVAVVVE